jgi:hypothetical protein
LTLLAGIRRAQVSVVCALLFACASVPAARAGQSSTSDAPAKKPSTTTTAKPTTPKKKSTTKSSRSTGTHKAGGQKTSSAAHTSSSTTAGKRSSHKKKTARVRGQQKIDSERAQAIQEALIREHYLTGDATGTWNQTSEDAMRRYQADHGWQSKEVPDSRALIKLGLGPSKDHLLNPDSAMTTGPDAPHAQSLPTTSHSPSTTSDPIPTTTPPPADSPSPQ